MTVYDLPAELTNLPKPELIEELSWSAILDRKIAKLKGEFTKAGLTAYTVDRLKYDPAIILLDGASYDEMLVRQRINEAIRAQMLPFAFGGDLDILAKFYDVTRMYGELDGRLRRRIVLAIQGRSTGGTEARYRSIALAADIRVDDAIVYTKGRSPVIHVAVFSTDPSGIADPMLIAKVDAAVQDLAARMVNDTIVVASAVRTSVNIEADVWLLPETSTTIFNAMEASLRIAWSSSMSLGRDLTLTWWTARLMIEGVHRVAPIAPNNDVIVPFNEAAAIGAVKLNFKGRDF